MVKSRVTTLEEQHDDNVYGISYQKVGGYFGPNVGHHVFATLLTILGFILILISYFMPWYTYQVSTEQNSVTTKVEITDYLNKEKYTYTDNSGQKSYESLDWKDSKNKSIGDTFTIIKIFQIITILIALFAIIAIILAGILFQTSANKIGVILNAIVLILAAGTPIILILVLPGHMKTILVI